MAFRKLFFKRVNESRSNFLLAEGDIALDESTFKLFRGDGTTVGGVAISGLGGVESLSEDTSPSLGGDLDTNGNSIISASNANINIVPNGTGDVTLQTDTVQIGDSNTDATITTNGTGDLTLNTNSGTDSGSIVIADAANGNITITPNGSGQVVLDGLSFPTADGSANQVLQTDGSGNLSFATVLTDVVTDTTPQLGGDLDINGNDIVSVSNGNINLLPNGSGKVILDGDGSSGGVTITDGNIDIRTGTGAVSKVKFYCESSNAHAQTLQAQPHSAGSSAVITLPVATGTLIGSGDTGSVSNTMLAGSIAASKLAGSIGNSKLSNSSITIGSDAIALGASRTDINGLTSLDVDNITIDGNVISSTDTNGNITLTPNGSGKVVLDGLTYPASDGTNGQVIVTNGSGVLSFSSAGGGTTVNRFKYTATAGQTAFTGNDDASASLSFTDGKELVYVNGVFMEKGTDYSTSGGNTVTLSDAATVGDEVNIVALS